jgi:hypothetical protein
MIVCFMPSGEEAMRQETQAGSAAQRGRDLYERELRTRYRIPGEMDQRTAEEMIEDANGSLAALTLSVVLYENPRLAQTLIDAPHAHAEIIDVIERETNRCFAGEG